MTSSLKTIVLVTGATSGIGLELVTQLLSDATKHVLLGSRSVEKGTTAVKDLASRSLPGSIELLQIDVSNEDSITAAAKEVEARHGRLDALVNNAGIADSNETSMFQKLNTVFRTNAAGPYATVEAFAPLLSKSTTTPRIVNVSSGAGSIGLRLDPKDAFYKMKQDQYRVSKAALNMVTACQITEYQSKGWKVFAYCPGWTATKPTSEGASPIVKMLNGGRDAEAGKFLTHGGEYPW
ncbi:putative short-chain dehydrogenase [Plenodomus tracheiphilus IPT5]|uniref:Short-chain dehydrogenase n=1 Tax=Plenodomus tracheiphilus IPT5 TaxID=1408161 RepID=A0A6A7AZU5_9PLEO|nr:putative short-chain dehydrogenase [Plenodomus tracheiphilus IPT5]